MHSLSEGIPGVRRAGGERTGGRSRRGDGHGRSRPPRNGGSGADVPGRTHDRPETRNAYVDTRADVPTPTRHRPLGGAGGESTAVVLTTGFAASRGWRSGSRSPDSG